MAKSFVGPRDRTAYLPPHLPSGRDITDFVAPGHLLARIPCTRYWGTERRPVVNGLPPAKIPGFLQKFDWLVGWEHGWISDADFPASVFCHPNALPEFTGYLRANYSAGVRSGSLLAIGGEDTNLSAQSQSDIDTLATYFDGIFYEGKDVPNNKVQTLVCGVNEFYLRGHEAHFMELIETTPTDRAFKIVAGWGAWWPQLDEQIHDRASAVDFSKSNPLIDFGISPFDEYLTKLHRSQFMLCPYGNGVQAAKMIEALLLGCIPILTAYPASLEMRDRGLPILVVDKWTDIDRPVLEEAAESLAPRAHEFRKVLSDLDSWWTFLFHPSVPANAH